MGNTITLSGVDFIPSNDGTWTIEGGAVFVAESFVSIFDAIVAFVEASESGPGLDGNGELYYLAYSDFDFHSSVSLAQASGLHGVACELVEAMIQLGTDVVGKMEVDEDGPDYYQARAATWNAMV